MLKITEVRYTMKRSNGNYGSDEVAYTAQVGEGENPEHAAAKLKLLAEQQLHGEEWRQGYLKAQQHLRDAEMGSNASEASCEQARQVVRNYENWAEAVAEVRREVMPEQDQSHRED